MNADRIESARKVAGALAANGWSTGGDFEYDFLPDVAAALSLISPAPAEQGGRVDEAMTIEEKCKVIQENRDYWYGVAEEYRQKLFDAEAALAQNAQGKAVAEIGQCWDLRYLGADSIASIAKRHNLKVGDKLYTRAERARVPDGWRITPERNPLGGKSAMRLHAPDGRSALFGTFSEEVLARDFLNLLAAAPSQPEDAGHDE